MRSAPTRSSSGSSTWTTSARATSSLPRPSGSGGRSGGASSAAGPGSRYARYKNSAAYAAVLVEVVVDDATAKIAMKRAVIAADAGQVVDPSGLANQLEGGFVQSLSWTLLEEVDFDDTRVTSLDWETYPILTFPAVPPIETVLLDRPGEPYLGAGEATTGPTAGAVGNALREALGVRLYDVPFTSERIRKAVAGG